MTHLSKNSAAFAIAAPIALALVTPSALVAQAQFPSDGAVREIFAPLLPGRGSGGVVIGMLDADGTRRVVTVGSVPYDGRTLFEIASITKVFTGILLAEMAERGEVWLDQPVAELLPDSVRVPSRAGRQITLRDLAPTRLACREGAGFALQTQQIHGRATRRRGSMSRSRRMS